jgi:hypothetical protein
MQSSADQRFHMSGKATDQELTRSLGPGGYGSTRNFAKVVTIRGIREKHTQGTL